MATEEVTFSAINPAWLYPASAVTGAETAPVPRSSEDEPWKHPADKGEPLDGAALWTNNESLGFFQSQEEFPDDLIQALRKVIERLHRGGIRDWELECDYVEVSPWFMRRGLEVNARAVFRLWFGEENWQAPLRRASHQQEIGQVEYRIDHLLQTELGVEIRRREMPVEAIGALLPREPQGSRRQPHFLELPNDFWTLAPQFMRPGEFMTCHQIIAEMERRVEYAVKYPNVYQLLSFHPKRFMHRAAKSCKGRRQAMFALRADTSGPAQISPSRKLDSKVK